MTLFELFFTFFTNIKGAHDHGNNKKYSPKYDHVEIFRYINGQAYNLTVLQSYCYLLIVRWNTITNKNIYMLLSGCVINMMLTLML